MFYFQYSTDVHILFRCECMYSWGRGWEVGEPPLISATLYYFHTIHSIYNSVSTAPRSYLLPTEADISRLWLLKAASKLNVYSGFHKFWKYNIFFFTDTKLATLQCQCPVCMNNTWSQSCLAAVPFPTQALCRRRSSRISCSLELCCC